MRTKILLAFSNMYLILWTINKHIARTIKRNSIKKASLVNAIINKTEDIRYFWQAEFATSNFILMQQTFAKKENLLSTIIERIQKLDSVVFPFLILDNWSNHKMNNYLGMMITIYNKATQKLCPFLLKIPRCESHTASTTYNQIQELLDDFPGLSNLLVGMTSDNASNMLRLSKDLELGELFGNVYLSHVPCLSHSTNLMNSCLIQPSSIEENNENSEENEPGDEEEPEDHMILINSFDLKNYIDSKLLEKFDHECMLNPDGTQGITYEDDVFFEYLRGQELDKEIISLLTGHQLLQKNNQLAAEIKMSMHKRKIYDANCARMGRSRRGEGLRLKSFCRTRWMSAVETFKRLLFLKPVILSISTSSEFETKFTHEEFNIVKDILSLLEPFATLCETLSSDRCTVKYALPLLVRCKCTMKTNSVDYLSNDDNNFSHLAHMTQFMQKMDKYVAKYKNNDICLISSFLTISFDDHPIWTQIFPGKGQDGSKGEFIRSKIAKMITKMLLPLLNISFYNSEDEDTCSEGEADSSFIDSFVHNSSKDSKNSFDDTTENIANNNFDFCSIENDLCDLVLSELKDFRLEAQKQVSLCFAQNKLKMDPSLCGRSFNNICKTLFDADLYFWSQFGDKFPILSLVNNVLKNIPASSIHIERFFSMASRIADKRKTDLSDKMFSSLCILKSFGLKVDFTKVNIHKSSVFQAMEYSEDLKQSNM